MSEPDAYPTAAAFLGPGRCHGCCRTAPTRHATYRQNIGLLLVRFRRGVEGEFCAPCRSRYFWTYTGVTSVLGWWGIISFFTTLVVLPANVVTHLSRPARSSDDPGAPAAGACHWCGNRDLRDAEFSPALIVAAVLGALLAFMSLVGASRVVTEGDLTGLVSLVGVLIGAVPVTGLVLRLRHRLDHCPTCGNDQPAA